jgi:hypothetical protein
MSLWSLSLKRMLTNFVSSFSGLSVFLTVAVVKAFAAAVAADVSKDNAGITPPP